MAPIVHGLEMLYGDQINFVVLDMDKTGNDEYGQFIQILEYNPRIRPGFYILDPDGNVIWYKFGPVNGRELQEILVEAIEQYN
jgi:hypothetical protein